MEFNKNCIKDETASATQATPKTKKAQAKKIKYEPGLYTSDRPIQFIRELKQTSVTTPDGKATRTFGTWIEEDNFIRFAPGVKTELTLNQIEASTSLQLAIQNNLIRRTL